MEAYLARWELRVRHNLAASEAETLPMTELFSYADEDDRRAWEELRLGCTDAAGDPALREVIAETYETAAADDVICFASVGEAIYLAMRVLLGPADHAVVVTPGYQAAETVPMSVCEVTGVALDPDNRWALDVDTVFSAFRPNTRVLAVNFPNNPTGAVVGATELRQLAAGCEERGVTLVSDEIFRGLERNPRLTLPQAADLSPTAVSLNAVSKTLGLPGLRIAWAACRDRDLRRRLALAKHYTSISNAAPSEVLARIAIKAREQLLARNRQIVANNIPIFEAFFDGFPDWFEFSAPDGGCVCFPRYRGPATAEDLCRALLAEAGVLLLPPSLFRSTLTHVPADRFRLGIGRQDAHLGLAALDGWLRRLH